ncbi:PEP-CTERM sorting domain-containing protein [Stieleria varia]|uniref:Ice-binding protein C-terminal domain-containing protein n=1 Tax=Stieleria varia TaxID=2528005 RepID=A0A5C6AY00_9BACT|nr:PEP-CTERM sorting domain-containing protein [Stieleria varia]TWU02994.1 hypothetical protein Pla52n_40830 [Stieleria varia]
MISRLVLCTFAAFIFVSGATAYRASAAIVASHDFDAPMNLTGSTSSPIAFNGFTSTGDAWGIYDFNTGGPFSLFDDTVAGSGGGAAFAGDSLGIVQSTKTDSFFGINDTTNGDVADGEMTGTFTFDISSATGGLTSIGIDFAGMGDFEASDLLTISYSIDGGAFTDIFVSSVDEAVSKDYTMESGTVITLDDPMSINGVELSNSFQTISANVGGTGNSLTLQVFADTNADEAIGFDNIVINGLTAVPEPGAFFALMIGMAGVVTARRRRR